MQIETNCSQIAEENGQILANEAIVQLNHNMTLAVLPVTIFIGLECLIGLTGNILIILVYSLRYEKSNFRYFVISMAIIDLTSCLTTLPGEMFSQMNWYTYEHAWICKVKSYFNVLTAWASASILFALAFDRYRKICHPLAWQLRRSIALRLCFAAVIVAAIVASPITVLWGKQDYLYVDGNLKLNVSICEKSGQYADDIYPFLYIASVYILPVGIMLLIVCTLNVLTAKTLFCGMDDLSKDMYKYSSVSTLQSVVSTVSLGNIFPNRIPNDRSMAANLNINGTNIDIWFDTGKPATDSIDTSSDNDVVMTAVRQCDSDPGSSASVTHNSERDIAKFSLSYTSSSNSGSSDSLGSRSLNRMKTREKPEYRRKRKTLIMLVLTSVFVVTMLMYVIMISLVADSEGTLKNLSNSEKAVFFFFWRMYFINCIVNPILYGFIDPRFRSGLVSLTKVIFKRK